MCKPSSQPRPSDAADLRAAADYLIVDGTLRRVAAGLSTDTPKYPRLDNGVDKVLPASPSSAGEAAQ